MVAFVWFLFAWVDCFCLCLEVKVFLLCWLVAVRVQRHLAGGVTTFWVLFCWNYLPVCSSKGWCFCLPVSICIFPVLFGGRCNHFLCSVLSASLGWVADDCGVMAQGWHQVFVTGWVDWLRWGRICCFLIGLLPSWRLSLSVSVRVCLASPGSECNYFCGLRVVRCFWKALRKKVCRSCNVIAGIL